MNSSNETKQDEAMSADERWRRRYLNDSESLVRSTLRSLLDLVVESITIIERIDRGDQLDQCGILMRRERMG